MQQHESWARLNALKARPASFWHVHLGSSILQTRKGRVSRTKFRRCCLFSSRAASYNCTDDAFCFLSHRLSARRRFGSKVMDSPSLPRPTSSQRPLEPGQPARACTLLDSAGV